MTPERLLWQAVLYRAAMDAVAPETGDDGARNRSEADTWFRRGGKDFRQVCALANMDPDFVRDAYLDGRIDPVVLKAAGKAA